MVYRVDPGSSAQRHGLREGDRILAVNNNIVDHEDYAMVRLARDSLWNKGTFHSTSERKRSLTFAWALLTHGPSLTLPRPHDLEVPN